MPDEVPRPGPQLSGQRSCTEPLRFSIRTARFTTINTRSVRASLS